MFGNLNSGYSGYSMSNRAVEAYDNNEKPYSKWTKTAIMEVIGDWIDDGGNLGCSFDNLKKLKVREFKRICLYRSSWHHTSKYVNQTDFYSVNFDFLERVTDADVESWAKIGNQTHQNEDDERIIFHGNIHYLEWSGTRKHPKATECCLRDVNIEEKGCFYIVTDDSGKQLLRKKIGSNGTWVEKLENNL